MAINKVEANGETLIDLTNDTAEAEDVLEGQTFHLRSGAIATGTYRPSAEIESRLRATVGHSNKNLLDITKYTASTNVSNIQINETTGSLSFTATGRFKDVNYNNDVLGLEPNNNATYVVSCINNLVTETNGRLTVRSRRDNVVKYTVNFQTTGEKELIFTVDPETFPDGWYISIMATGSTSTTGSIDISNLMLREASISDDTFEPYVTPTDEKKQDKPVVLWEAALNSTGVSEVAISSLADAVSNYSYLKVVVTNELGTTITDQTAIQTDVEYNPSYIGQDVAKSTGGMLGWHEENGKLVFDRLFIWVFSYGTNISVIGLRDHTDAIGPPDTVPGLFIRKIIGIPK
jgi:hypothetical protein